MTKIVPIDQDIEKENPPEANQKLMGAMVEMLSGLDQRLNEYFENNESENPKHDEEKITPKHPPEGRSNPKLKP